MKKTLAFFTLLLGCVAMFAQSGPAFPYQAVVRNSQNQLIKDSTFAIGVEVYQGVDLKFSETQSVTTNANGQFTMNIGGGAVVSGAMNNVTDWSVAKFKLTYHLSEGDIVSENAVNPVPYALQAANNTAMTELLNTMYARMDSLGRLVDSLSNIPHGGAADGQPCPGAATVSDGTYTYHTVKIGSQCWTKENLKTESSMGTTRWPDNNENNVATYGLLYDRTALVQDESGATIRGICPVGWHVPNDDEWDELTNYLSTRPDEIYQCGYDASNIANALSAPTGWSNRDNEGCYAGNRSTTRNRTGFSALPAGSYYNGYNLFGSCAYFWSATTINASVRYRNLAYDYSTIRAFKLNSADCCFSVRCLKDAETGGGTTPSAPATMSCEDVMNCLGDTLDRLNARITSQGETITTQGTEIETLSGTVTAQGQTITAQGETITLQGETIAAQGNTIDSLAHIVDSLSDLAHGTTPGEVSCEQVMLCLGDTLDRLNARITSQGETITTQGETIATQGETITAQGETIDSLAHVVDSLAKLPHGGGEVADGQPCPGAKTVSDGTNTYNTVKIGNQCWMAQNLRTDVGGGVYPKKNNVTVTGADTVTYGRLYSWTAMMNGAISSNNVPSGVRGICPEGWHVPSDAEWDTLTKYVYNSANPDYKCSGCESSVWEQSTKCIAKALASTTGWSSNTSEGCNAGNTGDKANATGFAAVPAGYCLYDSFSRFGSLAYFWSATQGDGRYAWCRILSSNGSGVGRDFDFKDSGFSVRCLRDAGTGGGGTTPVPVEVSCEQVMECMGDTLGKLNTKIEAQGAEIETLNGTVTTQGQRIETLNSTVQSQGEKIDSLAHVVDSLANLIPGGDTTEVADGQPCPGAPTVSDGTNTYNTVKIGNQCWMKENLRTTTGLTENTNYWHANDQSANDETYGLLYNWAAVMQGKSTTNYPVSGDKVRGICPAGWHVPSNAEWTQLTTYVNSVADYKCNNVDNNIANALSDTTGWKKSSECGAGHGGSTTLNATGFSAVPAGNWLYGFSDFGAEAYFWSATEGTAPSLAWPLHLHRYNSIVISGEYSKGYGFSVRCLKDEGGSSATLPTVTTDSASTVTNNSAKLYGNVTDMGEKTEVNAGFKYGTSESTLTSIIVKDAAMTATDQFSCDITNLTANTQYYFKAFAANGTDTVYGEVKNFTTAAAVFTCGTSKVSDAQGNEYNTVQIGNQCWMAQNLRTTADVTVGTNCWHVNNSADKDETYGLLYNWAAVMQDAGSTNYPVSGDKVRGICPEGWHVPSDAEWDTLTNYVNSVADYKCGGNDKAIANALSTPTGWNNNSGCNPGNGLATTTNATGFSAVPTGYYYSGIVPIAFGSSANFWSATEYDDGASYRYLDSGNPKAGKDNVDKGNGYSVRCLRDLVYGGSDTPTTTFNCGTDKVKDIQNNEYSTVLIGSQCWTKENLRTKRYADGEYIELEQIHTPAIDDLGLKDIGGLLYTWSVATRDSSTTYPESGQVMVQGVCPSGWHVPSDSEWAQLLAYTRSNYLCEDCSTLYSTDVYFSCIAKALASNTDKWHESSNGFAVGNNPGVNNATGFSALPVGYFSYAVLGYTENARFWSATQNDNKNTDAWGMDISNYSNAVSKNFYNKSWGYSVRCLKN